MTLNDISEKIDKIEYQINGRNLSVRYAFLDDEPVRVFTDNTNKIDVIFNDISVYESLETDDKLKFRFMSSDGRKLTKDDQKLISESVRKVEQILAFQIELGFYMRTMVFNGRIVMLCWHADYGSFVWDNDYLYDCYEDEDGAIVVESPNDAEDAEDEEDVESEEEDNAEEEDTAEV